jgi:hypothetical protein
MAEFGLKGSASICFELEDLGMREEIKSKLTPLA